MTPDSIGATSEWSTATARCSLGPASAAWFRSAPNIGQPREPEPKSSCFTTASPYKRSFMTTTKLWACVDIAAAPRVEAVFDDIRANPQHPIRQQLFGVRSPSAAGTDVAWPRESRLTR
jgi:hypothetical protein